MEASLQDTGRKITIKGKALAIKGCLRKTYDITDLTSQAKPFPELHKQFQQLRTECERYAMEKQLWGGNKTFISSRIIGSMRNVTNRSLSDKIRRDEDCHWLEDKVAPQLKAIREALQTLPDSTEKTALTEAFAAKLNALKKAWELDYRIASRPEKATSDLSRTGLGIFLTLMAISAVVATVFYMQSATAGLPEVKQENLNKAIAPTVIFGLLAAGLAWCGLNHRCRTVQFGSFTPPDVALSNTALVIRQNPVNTVTARIQPAAGSVAVSIPAAN